MWPLGVLISKCQNPPWRERSPAPFTHTWGLSHNYRQIFLTLHVCCVWAHHAARYGCNQHRQALPAGSQGDPALPVTDGRPGNGRMEGLGQGQDGGVSVREPDVWWTAQGRSCPEPITRLSHMPTVPLWVSDFWRSWALPQGAQAHRPFPSRGSQYKVKSTTSHWNLLCTMSVNKHKVRAGEAWISYWPP